MHLTTILSFFIFGGFGGGLFEDILREDSYFCFLDFLRTRDTISSMGSMKRIGKKR